jgi:cytochrome c oxidase subunit 4
MILRDIPSTPAPIRSMYVKEAEDIKSLRVKERNSWKDLSKDEKVTLYRASFQTTYAEMRAPTGEWKTVAGGLGVGLGFAFLLFYVLREYVAPPTPHTITPEWESATKEKLLRQKANPIEGISSRH